MYVMSENKYHIKIARDETRSMGRAERLWYKGTAKWFLLFGLIVLAGVGSTLAFLSVRSNPVPKVSGARIMNPVVQNTAPHFYVKIEKGTAKGSKDGSTWNEMKSGAVLESGDAIQTQDESYVTLISSQNSIVRLSPNSQIAINDVSAPSAKIFQANLKLEKGQAWTNLVVSDDEKIIYSLSTKNFLMNAEKGVFSVENTNSQNISVVSGEVEVKEISQNENSDSILKDSITREYTVGTGKSASYKNSGKSEIVSLSSSVQNSYWWKWNKEQDADYERSLKNKVSDLGPPLDLSADKAVIAITEPYYEVTGRTSLDARIFVNNFEVANRDGTFTYKVSTPSSKDPFPVNVVAIDHLGNKTIKTFSLSYSESSEQQASLEPTTTNGIAMNLTAKSVEGGVELIWNSVSRSTYFDGYHIVRSESNGTLSYPKNEQFAEVLDNKTATYIDSGVAEGVTYYYRVCVKSGEDRYDCSNVFSLKHSKPKGATPTS